MELCLEIFMEEIPARMQRQAKIDFQELFAKEFKDLRITCTDPEVFIGPRRIALYVKNIAGFSETIIEERRGPKVEAPEVAIQGFLKSTGLTKNELSQENGYWIAKIEHTGKPINELFPSIIDKVLRTMPWPTSMRWPGASHTWVRPIRNMVNHETNELFFENLEIPVENLIGEEGKGFKYILDGLNAERALIAAECIGDGYWFIDKVTKYVNERIVFGRPIGQNQGVQFPIAKAFVNIEAASLMRYKACELYDAGQPCGAEANMAKMLAADASWEAANACLQYHGGFGFASEYDVERKFRETRLYQVAPISTNLILSYVAEHILGMPRSF